MITVIDYGMGNLRSVAKALEKVGAEVKVSENPQDVKDAAGVVLPGVGAFPDCMKNLDRLNLVEPILAAVESGKPFLGICLGLQALFTESEEFGSTPGLGLFPGKVVRFPEDVFEPDGKTRLKIPHMGWNEIKIKGEPRVLDGIDPGAYVYFVHSFYVAPEDPGIISTTTDYGMEFVSSVVKDNLFACQFHPEKSQAVGLKILANFHKMVLGEA